MGFPTNPTAGTGSTKSFWVPTTGDEPYIRPRTAPEKKEAIMKEFQIPLDQNDDSSKGPKVTFWHYERDIRGSQSRSKHKYDAPSTSQFVKDYFCGHESPADSMRAFLNGRDRGEFKASSGWDGWPQSHDQLREGVVAQAFVKFLNTVIEIQGLSDTHVAVDRQNVFIKTRDGSQNDLKPDVFVWAKQSGVYPPVKGKPSVISLKQVVGNRRRGVDTPAEISPAVDWPWCLIPIEIKTENGKNAVSDHLQVGAYVREVFAAQQNRRFVPSLLVTEVNFQFLLWDRAGVVISHPIDYYHSEENFDLFCSTLSAIVSWDPERVGFDTTLFYPEPTSNTFPDPPKMIIKAEIEEESLEGKVTNVTSYQIDDAYCRHIP